MLVCYLFKNIVLRFRIIYEIIKTDSSAKHPTPEMISKIEDALQYFNIIKNGKLISKKYGKYGILKVIFERR